MEVATTGLYGGGERYLRGCNFLLSDRRGRYWLPGPDDFVSGKRKERKGGEIDKEPI